MRVLVVCCTNTRQTPRAVDGLLASLVDRPDVEIVRWDLASEVTYPYPWGFLEFFGLFSDCVRGRGPELLPPPAEVQGAFDCVVLAYPVWFLSPALPMASFLASDQARRLLADTPVISLITCRNMWFNAGLETFARIRALGGRLQDSVVLQDDGPAWSTFITTPVWLLFGRKRFWRFPEAGISDGAFDGLSRLSDAWAAGLDRGWPPPGPLFTGLDSVACQERYVFPELVLKRVLFRPWAAIIGGLRAALPFLEKPLTLVFFFALLATVVLLIPLLLISRIVFVLAFRPRYRRLLEAVRAPYPPA